MATIGSSSLVSPESNAELDPSSRTRRSSKDSKLASASRSPLGEKRSLFKPSNSVDIKLLKSALDANHPPHLLLSSLEILDCLDDEDDGDEFAALLDSNTKKTPKASQQGASSSKHNCSKRSTNSSSCSKKAEVLSDDKIEEILEVLPQQIKEASLEAKSISSTGTRQSSRGRSKKARRKNAHASENSSSSDAVAGNCHVQHEITSLLKKHVANRRTLGKSYLRTQQLLKKEQKLDAKLHRASDAIEHINASSDNYVHLNVLINSKKVPVYICRTATIFDLLEEVREDLPTLEAGQGHALTFDGKLQWQDNTLDELCVTDGDTFSWTSEEILDNCGNVNSKNEGKIVIRLKISEKSTENYRLDKNAPLQKLASAVAQQLNLPDSSISLKFDGDTLDLNTSPEDNEMEDEDMIDVHINNL
ncbi:uncharacterized protein LOC126318319 [Schistocerca gregaria]|uniref:uncharacterized protein LOC126318319 n=1 Tax=Schistocerca gregaria TaxID=7010 RepID=UPI00211DFF98|nr:uncharacterized protein LOC126318319 [Schistocerca gregaria]